MRVTNPKVRRVGEAFGAAPGLAPVGVLLVISVIWSARQGGIGATTWYPGAIVIALMLVTVLWSVRFIALPKRIQFAITLFAAFTVWSYLSIIWSPDGATAWDGANKTALYLIAFSLAAAWSWRPSTAAAALFAFALGVAIVGLQAVISASNSTDPTSWFISGRLAAPVGYPNANAALFLMSVWVLLPISSARTMPVIARGASMALTTVLLELALLSQSRASIAALPIVLIVFLVLSPRRLRALTYLLVPVAATALASPKILDVYPAVVGGNAKSTLSTALTAIAISASAAAVIGLGAAWLDTILALPARFVRVARVASVCVAILVAIAALAVAVSHGAPARVAHGWSEFRDNAVPSAGSSHLTAGLGSSRYDFWRVGWDLMLRHPFGGIGADNFAAEYLQHRRSAEEPTYPHSLEIRLLSETGIVGTLLFVSAIVAASSEVVRRRRSLGQFGQMMSAGAVAAFVYWLVHGSVDWLWEFPALSVVAFVFLAISARLSDVAPVPVPSSRWFAVLVRPVVTLASVAVIASMVLPWLSAENTARAADHWGADPTAAFAMLRRAASLDPLSDEPDLVAGAIASRLTEWPRMREEFAAAVTRNPGNWYSHLELAIAEGKLGHGVVARHELARARQLDPREPVIPVVAQGLRSPSTLDPAAIDHLFIAQTDAIIK